jgi:uncharacterized protein (DUF433 family)
MADATITIPSLIYLDAEGRARLHGTRFKVIQLARDARAGMDVEALRDAYPHLTLAQIHAALSYYYANQQEMDAQIDRADHEASAFIVAHPNPLTRAELLKRLDRE